MPNLLLNAKEQTANPLPHLGAVKSGFHLGIGSPACCAIQTTHIVCLERPPNMEATPARLPTEVGSTRLRSLDSTASPFRYRDAAQQVAFLPGAMLDQGNARPFQRDPTIRNPFMSRGPQTDDGFVTAVDS